VEQIKAQEAQVLVEHQDQIWVVEGALLPEELKAILVEAAGQPQLVKAKEKRNHLLV
tara:strand:- start:228 stop:398 length:171 start_codon:yes stop_codon:yes gene_type:complete